MTPDEKQRAVARVLHETVLPGDISIRAWQESDFPAVQRLSRAEGWPTPSERPAEAIMAWHNSWPALVVVSSGAIIGFLRAISDGAVTTYVAELLVAPDWRGRGIGSLLLDTAQALYPGSRLDLLSTEDSDGFYHRVGFRAFPGYRRGWVDPAAPRFAGISEMEKG